MPRTVRGVHHTTVMDKATSLCSRCQHVCSSLVVLPPYFTLSQNLIKSVTLKVARVVTHVTGVYLQAQRMDDGTGLFVRKMGKESMYRPKSGRFHLGQSILVSQGFPRPWRWSADKARCWQRV